MLLHGHMFEGHGIDVNLNMLKAIKGISYKLFIWLFSKSVVFARRKDSRIGRKREVADFGRNLSVFVSQILFA